MRAHSHAVVVACEPRQLDARLDSELREDVTEMAVYRVWRDEEPLGDFAVRQTVGDQLRDSELRRGHRRPSSRLRLDGNKSATHTEITKPAANAPRVPGGADLGVDVEGAAESVDPGLTLGGGELDTQVLERRCQLEATRPVCEQRHRLVEVRTRVLEEPSDVCRHGSDRRGGGVQLGASP